VSVRSLERLADLYRKGSKLSLVHLVVVQDLADVAMEFEHRTDTSSSFRARSRRR
jgi:hypothetical protein